MRQSSAGFSQNQDRERREQTYTQLEFTAAPDSPVAGESTDKNTFNIQTDRLQLADEKEGLLFISISDEVTFYLLLLGIIIFLCLLIWTHPSG